MDYKEFLSNFQIENGLMAVCVGNVSNAKFYKDITKFELPTDPTNVFFAPSNFSSEYRRKEHWFGTKYLWVDADKTDQFSYLIPPTFIIRSGHGFHGYYKLKEIATVENVDVVEYANKVIGSCTDSWGRKEWDCVRLLRIPDTFNLKEGMTPVPVKFLKDSGHVYDLADIVAFGSCTKEIRDIIKTGSSENFSSRSERDYKVTDELRTIGCSESFIEILFADNPVGDKSREKNGEKYLAHTLSKHKSKHIRDIAEKNEPNREVSDIREELNSYWVGKKQVSTFVIKPLKIVREAGGRVEDIIICNIHSSRGVTLNMQMPKKAFTSVSQLDKYLKNANWTWMGTDTILKQLLPFLISTYNLEETSVTSVIGLYERPDKSWEFVGTDGTITKDNDEPILTWNEFKEHPWVQTTEVAEPDDDWRHILDFNEPNVIWPLIGWFTSALCKPILELNNYRMPMLNIFGTKGSGKTTLVERIFLPLFGQTRIKSWDANTTRFVMMTLQGSTNNIPISYSEFRLSHAIEKLTRLILLSYDNGVDARGTAAQEVITYPLLAPFIVTGEDLISDPACRERIIISKLDPRMISVGSPCHTALEKHRSNLPLDTFKKLLKFIVQKNNWEETLTGAQEDVSSAFVKMPDRVRNNLTVAWHGVKMWCELQNYTLPLVSVLSQTYGYVVSGNGIVRNMSDEFVSDIINAIPTPLFKWKYDETTNKLWIHFASAHSFWILKRTREQRAKLENDAIKSQLSESDYYLGTREYKFLDMHGIDIQKAHSMGLDIPSKLDLKEFTLQI